MQHSTLNKFPSKCQSNDFLATVEVPQLKETPYKRKYLYGFEPLPKFKPKCAAIDRFTGTTISNMISLPKFLENYKGYKRKSSVIRTTVVETPQSTTPRILRPSDLQTSSTPTCLTARQSMTVPESSQLQSTAHSSQINTQSSQISLQQVATNLTQSDTPQTTTCEPEIIPQCTCFQIMTSENAPSKGCSTDETFSKQFRNDISKSTSSMGASDLMGDQETDISPFCSFIPMTADYGTAQHCSSAEYEKDVVDESFSTKATNVSFVNVKDRQHCPGNTAKYEDKSRSKAALFSIPSMLSFFMSSNFDNEQGHFWSWQVDQIVKLREDFSLVQKSPITLPAILEQSAKNFGCQTALCAKQEGLWARINYHQYLELVKLVGMAYIKFGLKQYDVVAFFGKSSPEWYIGHMAAIYVGGISTSVYLNLVKDDVEKQLIHSRAKIILIGSSELLEIVDSLHQNIINLKVIVQYQGKMTICKKNVYGWQDVIGIGKSANVKVLEERKQALRANQCCSLMYPAIFSEPLQAVMLSHDNIAWTVRTMASALNLKVGCERHAAFNPNAHVSAQIVDMYIPLVTGAEVWFPEATVSSYALPGMLREIRPSVLFAHSAIFEMLLECIQAIIAGKGPVSRRILAWAMKRGRMLCQEAEVGFGTSSVQTAAQVCFGLNSFGLADRLSLNQLLSQIGLRQCRFLGSFLSPLSVETLRFFASIHLPIKEWYGMTECCGVHCCNLPMKWKFGMSGQPLCGVNTDLVNVDNSKVGEIRMFGRNVFMGYLRDQQHTQNHFDQEFRLCTNDLAMKDEHGHYKIIGNINDNVLIDENVWIMPNLLEERLKRNASCISNCMVVGGKKGFVIMLITLKSELDPVTLQPTDRLRPAAIAWMIEIGSNLSCVSEIINSKDETVHSAMQKAVDEVNQLAVSDKEKIKAWIFLLKDFSIAGGELSDTYKLKRELIMSKYKDLIEKISIGWKGYDREDLYRMERI